MLDEWAAEFSIPPVALAALKMRMGMHAGTSSAGVLQDGKSESAAQADIRLAAPKHGTWLWRNNVGALRDSRGVPVRYGLANDSAQVNKIIKSGDLIGIEQVLITPAHVGRYIGRFLSIECKRPGFVYTDTDARLKAQGAWIGLVNALGGRACFATGPDCLTPPSNMP